MKFDLRATILITATVTLVTGEARRWHYDVYTGRHFNSIVTSPTWNDDVAVVSTLLVLYAPQCEDEARRQFATLRPWGPMDKYMVVAVHDYVTYPKHIWYKLDQIDDLKQRYIMPEDHCLKILFIAPGSRLSHYDAWQREMSLYDWAWNHFLTDVTLYNHLDQPITMRKEGQGNPWVLTTLDPGAKYIAETHIGLAVTCTDSKNKLLYALWLEPRHRHLPIHITQELVESFQQSSHTDNPNAWQEYTRALREVESRRIMDTQWQHAESVLLGLKQPVLLPRFTKLGYHKTRILEQVYTTLRDFYDSTKATQGVANESMNSFIAINGDEVKTGMVQLSDEVKQFVHKELLEQMQEWCNCELEETAFYGIREYYKGNVLRMHVDRVETHVISSILQIDQDLGETQNDWLLEIIDFKGERHEVVLYPGEMLLYESATLIHGRPQLFTGKHFANCFLHYKPRVDWSWRRVHGDRGYFMTDGNIEEPLDIISTPRTLNIRQQFVKEEL